MQGKTLKVYAGDFQATDQSGPDFVCIGAQKSGAMWFYENLCRHSDVWMPPVKEQIIMILKEHVAGTTVPDLDRRHGLAENTIYR